MHFKIDETELIKVSINTTTKAMKYKIKLIYDFENLRLLIL